MTGFVSLTICIALSAFGAVLFFGACVADRCAVKRAQPENKTPCARSFAVQCVIFVLLGGLLSLWTGAEEQNVVPAVLKILLLALLGAVALIDHHTMEIPDTLNIAIGVLGVVSCIGIQNMSLFDHLIGMVCVSLPLTLIVLFIPGAFGGGDIKLMAACGLFLGWRDTLLAAFIAILLGGIWGVILLIRKKKGGGDHFAFGPFLCTGVAACLLLGDSIARAFVACFDFSRFFC